MSFTQDDLIAINEAIGTGELEVSFSDGSKLRYRSIAELITIKTHIQTELSRANGKRRPSAFRVNTCKGV